MKRLIIALVFTFALAMSPDRAVALTADQYFTSGTNALAQQTMTGLTTADGYFRAALAADPNHERANVMLGLTRILILVNQSPGTEFLTSLGFPLSGRNVYNWTSSTPRDGNRKRIVPSGISANAIPGHLRSNVLAQLAAAEANLSKVTSTGFLLTLGGDVTTSSNVTLDKGDILMLRAGLDFFQYFIYTLNGQNTDAQLTTLKSLSDAHDLTLERLLANYPGLFTFATTADLNAAKTVFQNFVSQYNVASTFVRARGSQQSRLFMYDSADANMVREEANFRKTIADLNTSFTSGATLLQTDHSLMVNAGKHFDGSSTWRAYLPQFSRSRFIIGTFPDVTFGGQVAGLGVNGVEKSALHLFKKAAVRIEKPPVPVNNEIQIQFTAITNLNYDVLGTFDFANWFPITNFVANSRNVSFKLPLQGGGMGFLRIEGGNGNNNGGGGNNQHTYQVFFDPYIEVTPCNGGSFLVYTSQEVSPDGSGNFSDVWEPMIPLVNVNGNVNQTTFSASLNCLSGGNLTSLSATRTGQYYEGSTPNGRFYVTDQNDKVYIEGRVVDSDSGDPIAGATIATSLDGVTATSDNDGYFMLITTTATNYSTTPYTVTATKSGYQDGGGFFNWGDHPTQVEIGMSP